VYLSLDFYYGADLPDPQNPLEGTGKSLRHVKVEGLDQLEDPALRRLLKAASGYLPKLQDGV
jgi:hypothetical protein